MATNVSPSKPLAVITASDTDDNPGWHKYRQRFTRWTSVSTGVVFERDLLHTARVAALKLWDLGPSVRARHASAYLKYEDTLWSEEDAAEIADALVRQTDAREQYKLFELLVVIARDQLIAGPLPATTASPTRHAPIDFRRNGQGDRNGYGSQGPRAA